MAYSKIVFIIPGYLQSPKSLAYKKICRIFKGFGYLPIPVEISWKNSTISENSKQFIKKFKKYKAKEKYILGFSYGAMIAYISSQQIKTKGLVLCSLSPYFKEDIKNKKISKTSELIEARYNDFTKHNAEKIAKNLKTEKVFLLYGKQEARSLVKRVTNSFEHIKISNKKLIAIKKTEHDLGNINYFNKIEELVKSLDKST